MSKAGKILESMDKVIFVVAFGLDKTIIFDAPEGVCRAVVKELLNGGDWNSVSGPLQDYYVAADNSFDDSDNFDSLEEQTDIWIDINDRDTWADAMEALEEIE